MKNEKITKKDFKADAFVESLKRNLTRDNSVFNDYIRGAVELALQTHEIDQKQKRKGKGTSYISHPLTVGLILAKAGAPEHIIVAGILHDTVEDSVEEKKVTFEMLTERFYQPVSDIIWDLTEHNKALPWKERKLEALKHIEAMEGPSLWVKSADVISNVSELLSDYKREGDQAFSYFNAAKVDIIANYRAVIDVLLKRWGDDSTNPMILDLRTLAYDLDQVI